MSKHSSPTLPSWWRLGLLDRGCFQEPDVTRSAAIRGHAGRRYARVRGWHIVNLLAHPTPRVGHRLSMGYVMLRLPIPLYIGRQLRHKLWTSTHQRSLRCSKTASFSESPFGAPFSSTRQHSHLVLRCSTPCSPENTAARHLQNQRRPQGARASQRRSGSTGPHVHGHVSAPLTKVAQLGAVGSRMARRRGGARQLPRVWPRPKLARRRPPVAGMQQPGQQQAAKACIRPPAPGAMRGGAGRRPRVLALGWPGRCPSRRPSMPKRRVGSGSSGALVQLPPGLDGRDWAHTHTGLRLA